MNNFKMKVIKSSNKIKNCFLNTLFPPKCIGCKKEGSYICKDCEIFISESTLICPICGRESFKGETHKKCKNNSLDGLVTIWDYEGIIGKGLRLVKYKEITDILNEFIKRAFKIIVRDKERFSSFLKLTNQNTAIIPLTNKKMFNIIAKEVGSYTNSKVIKKEKVKNFENVIIVSDIFNKGEKIKKKAKRLKEKGFKKVWGFALTRTV
ncbi:MAG TPA: double zinc ribbon domain-containing protein [Halanaerobiales bacterium]|nr:double zinc ribbon domain-containing protein [Halanaerobiales bacterium]